MSKRDEIIAVIKKCAEKLGRAPGRAEFQRASKISWHQVYKHFRGMRAAVRAAGLEPGPRGGPLNEKVMVLDWAKVVRELGRLPSRGEYDRLGKHHSVTLHARLVWSQMAHHFVLLVREFHLQREWGDVVEIVCKKYALLKSVGRLPAEEERLAADQRRETQIGRELVTCEFARMEANRAMRLGRVVAATLAVQILMAAGSTQQSAVSIQFSNWQLANGNWPEQGKNQNIQPLRTLKDTEERPQAGVPVPHKPKREPVVYGAPLGIAAMAHAPTNEDGVIFLFGVMAAELGFRVERIQRGFPDCEAKREVAPGKWEWTRIEFEYESRNFKEHRHDPAGCDVIVCWRHNWADIPEGLEVVELSRFIGRSGDRDIG
jgi:hypothetical protein